ncbi:MAG: hypothetical protein AB8I08_01360 [Sandaracinaceae bacterium]
MRTLTPWALGLMTLVYGTTLLAAVDFTRRYETRQHPGNTLAVFSPLEAGERATQVIDGREIRRSCDAGRCELLAGQGGGFTILASYPRGHWVTLDLEGNVELYRLGQRHGPRVEEVRLLWATTGILGALLFGWLIARGLRLRARLQRLGPSRTASIDDRGVLSFSDGTLPKKARATERLTPGWVTGLWEVGGDGAPYRGEVLARWVAIEGDRDSNLLEAASALGTHRALFAGVSIATVALSLIAWV